VPKMMLPDIGTSPPPANEAIVAGRVRTALDRGPGQVKDRAPRHAFEQTTRADPLNGCCSVPAPGDDVGAGRTPQRLLPLTICSTRSTMRRRSLVSSMRMNALVSARPSEVARKSDT
jgi:hypothetical protein